MTTNPCPNKTELLEYLQGRLAEQQLAFVESHFADCDICEETIRGLVENDTLTELISEVATASDASETDDQSFVASLIDRLQATSTPAAKSLRSRSSEVTSRLQMGGTGLGTIAQYDVLSILGVGSTSVVYQARDTDLDRLVALKILRPSVGEAAQTRFMAEAKAAASIEHPNVVTIYQVGDAHGLVFIAMKWIPGESLEARLNRVTYLEEEQLQQIGAKICDGLEAAHQQNLIHRDIKPANIWLTEENDEPIILDFGLARIANDDPQMTATGMIAGTPNFMSPEQAKGHELDPRSDLFSLGCLFYRAATGKLPFSGNGILSTLQAIQNQIPNVPTTVNPHLGVDLSDLIMGLLEKQPGNRPGAAVAVGIALTKPRKAWPFVVAPASEPSVQAKPNRVVSRKRSAVGTFLRWTIGLLLCAATAFAGYKYRDEIVRIATNQGVLEIDAKDENVKIEILQNGELVRIIDTETDQKLDIKAGTYQLKLQDNRNGFELSAESVVMTRGGEAIVTVTKLDDDQPLATNKDKPISEPVFNGKTYSAWLSTLRTERNEEVVAEGLVALGYLAEDDLKKQKSAIEVVRPIVRRHGSRFVDNDRPIPESIVKFFSRIDAELLVDFIDFELQSGNLNSQEELQLIFLLSSGTGGTWKYYGNGTILTEAIAKQRGGWTRKLIEDLRNSKATQKRTSADLISSILQAELGSVNGLGINVRVKSLKTLPVVYEDILDAFNKADGQTKSHLGIILAKFNAANIDVAKHLGDLLGKESSFNRYEIFSILGTYDGEIPSQLVQGLLLYIQQQGDRSGFLQGGGAFGGGANLKPVFERLASFGAAAEEAIPVLEKLDRKKFDDKLIRQTIERIQNAVSKQEEKSTTTIPSIGNDKAMAALYNGKTFQQWMNALRLERNTKIIADGLIAVGHLSEFSKDLQQQAIEVARSIARRSGSMIVGDDDDIPNALTQFFSRIQPDLFVDYIKTEIENGTPQSRSQNVLLIQLARSDGGVLSVRYAKDRDGLRTQFAETRMDLLKSTFRLLDSADSKTSKAGYETAMAILGIEYRRVVFQANVLGGSNDQIFINQDLTKYLVKEFQNSQLEKRYYLASLLANFEVVTPAIAEALAEALVQADLPANDRKLTFLLVEKFSGEAARVATPFLVKILKDESLLQNITLINSLPNDDKIVAIRLIQTLQRFGPFAKEALPYLKTLVDHPVYFSVAQQAIKTIEETTKSQPKPGGDGSPETSESSNSNSSLSSSSNRYTNYAESLVERYDANGDGKLDKKETGGMRAKPNASADANKDGFITVEEFADSLSGNVRTFGGRTLYEWMKLLETEVDSKTIVKGIEALAALARNSSQATQLRILDLVQPMMRTNDMIGLEKGRPKSITQLLDSLEPGLLYGWLLSELPKSNQSQFNFIERYLDQQLFFTKNEPAIKEILRRREQFIDVLLERSISDSPETIDSVFGTICTLIYSEQLGPPEDAILNIIAAKMKESQDTRHKLRLSQCLLKTEIGGNEKIDIWLTALRDGQSDLLDSSYFMAKVWPAKRKDELLDTLVEAIEKNKLQHPNSARRILKAILIARTDVKPTLKWVQTQFRRFINSQRVPESLELAAKWLGDPYGSIRYTVEGRTLEEWMALMETELDEPTIEKGIRAMGKLATTQPKATQLKALEFIRPFVRRHGHPKSGNGIPWELVVFFGNFSPELVYDWMEKEIPQANTSSMWHLQWFALVGSIYSERAEEMERQRQAKEVGRRVRSSKTFDSRQKTELNKRRGKLIEAVLQTLDPNEPERNLAAFNLLRYLATTNLRKPVLNTQYSKQIRSRISDVQNKESRLRLNLLAVAFGVVSGVQLDGYEKAEILTRLEEVRKEIAELKMADSFPLNNLDKFKDFLTKAN